MSAYIKKKLKRSWVNRLVIHKLNQN
jgi:hypothetical protein